uniref:Uncharacterized protein n=4 Tax=Aegilops tauschii subsp. strangulata TaxID=200361 RepID=A0A453BWU8_AEGTS
ATSAPPRLRTQAAAPSPVPVAPPLEPPAGPLPLVLLPAPILLPRGNPSRRPLPLVLLPAPLPGGAPDRRATSAPPRRRTQAAAPSPVPVAPPLEMPAGALPSPEELGETVRSGGGGLLQTLLRLPFLPRRLLRLPPLTQVMRPALVNPG